MVFTLHRYIFRELIKIFLLSTIALSAIINLTLMLEPIQEVGVGPEQVPALLACFLPIALTFVLPIAAIFASALTYGRFASDNELDACRASGVSLMTLVYPGLCLAIGVSIVTLILSFHVVPRFVHRAEVLIKANAKQIVFRNIQRNGYYILPNSHFMLYADDADIKNDILSGITAVESKDGKINNLIVAEAAKIVIDTEEGYNTVQVIAKNCYQIDSTGQQSYFETLPITSGFPPLLSDRIKFQTIDKVKKIRPNMMEFNPIRQLAYETRDQLATEMLAEAINKTFADDLSPYFVLEYPDGIIQFTADSCTVRENSKNDNEQTIDLKGNIKLFVHNSFDRHVEYEYSCQTGTIQMERGVAKPKLVLVLDGPKWRRSDGISGLAQKRSIKYLNIPSNITEPLEDKKLLATINELNSVMQTKATKGLRKSKATLLREMWITGKEIVSETHWRLVFGLGCILMVLLSIAIGIMLKGGHLLSSFGVSLIPAGVLAVAVMAGKNMTTTHKEGTNEHMGIMVMWLGLVILCVTALVMFRKLRRN